MIIWASHAIGGFAENFSTVQYFCRYCLVTEDEFSQNCLAQGLLRTPENYDNHVQNLSTILEYFHVCQPGLPPCLGHDLFEGIVSADLSLYIEYFVKNKWFTYEHLNRIIAQFKYLGGDSNNKPNGVNTNGTISGGHAVQNWCLLRLFPLFVCNNIPDGNDEVWQICLLLR